MTWAGLLQALLTAVGAFTSWLHDRQLIEAGAAQEALRGIRSAQDAIGRARAARDAVRDDAASISADQDNRDARL